MKRGRGDFEEQPRGNGDDGEQHQNVIRPAARECHLDVLKIGGTGHAVHQRKSVSQDAGAECSEKQVLERGLVGALLAPQKADQNVKRERHGFEAEKKHDEVGARGQEHHAHQREHDQRVVFAVMFVLDFQVAHR